MSAVLLLTRQPHWFSGKSVSAVVRTNLFKSILATILPAIENSVISR
ncbi:unnamed protein product [Brugia timori]|uniref:Transcriptional regulator n=1 Tax=Brugia timori TaxID=42155 RepID=A0A0R3Q8R3_9BILA|nr:unnamed protein product [Brugia timori]